MFIELRVEPVKVLCYIILCFHSMACGGMFQRLVGQITFIIDRWSKINPLKSILPSECPRTNVSSLVLARQNDLTTMPRHESILSCDLEGLYWPIRQFLA